MGTAIAVRADFSSQKLRRLATRVRDAAQARRLLAIAAVLDGAAREEAAKIGGMDRQTLRDWVIRFNDQGPDGLINKSSPGAPGKLSKEHKAFLARLVEEGPIPAIHGVVRWRACDLIMRLHEEFGISVSDDTVYRGSLCGRTGSQIGSSNPSTISSITAATLGTPSSISLGKSCPSRAATGQPWVTQCEYWYYTGVRVRTLFSAPLRFRNRFRLWPHRQ